MGRSKKLTIAHASPPRGSTVTALVASSYHTGRGDVRIPIICSHLLSDVFLPEVSHRSQRVGRGLRAMDPATYDAQLRQAAFSHVDRLAALRGGVLDSADLAGGFEI